MHARCGAVLILVLFAQPSRHSVCVCVSDRYGRGAVLILKKFAQPTRHLVRVGELSYWRGAYLDISLA